jgi:Flp pilus assembly pilin Flp
MKAWLIRLREAFGELRVEDSGQDLVEYALVAVVIALGAAASMGTIARDINNIFATLAAKFRDAAP